MNHIDKSVALALQLRDIGSNIHQTIKMKNYPAYIEYMDNKSVWINNTGYILIYMRNEKLRM